MAGLKLTLILLLVFCSTFCLSSRRSYSSYHQRSGGGGGSSSSSTYSQQTSLSGRSSVRSDYDDIGDDSELTDYGEPDALRINQPVDSSSNEVVYQKGSSSRGTTGAHQTWSSTREFDCGSGTSKTGGCDNVLTGGGSGKQESGWSSSWSSQSSHSSSSSSLPGSTNSGDDSEIESLLNSALRNNGNLNQTRTITTGGQPGATYYYHRRVYNWSSVASTRTPAICRTGNCNQTVIRTSSGRSSNRQYSQTERPTTTASVLSSSSSAESQYQQQEQQQQEEQNRYEEEQRLEELHRINERQRQALLQQQQLEQQRQSEYEEEDREPEPTTTARPTRAPREHGSTQYQQQQHRQTSRHQSQSQYRPQSQPTRSPSSRTSTSTYHRQINSKADVNTANGLCRGQLLTTTTGKEYYAFYGIPFAKPPVGELRFKRPEPIGPWDEPVIANTLPNSCYQINATYFPDNPGEQQWNPPGQVSEDCLYLNIWIPASIFRSREQDLSSVIFWIYGGGFYSGSSSLDIYDGAVLATEKEIIVVSCQYRVGPLGFLYLDSPDAPGNMGLLDQALALKWVHDNIKFFGGDKDSVTLMGESAGAASVTEHLTSPISRNLFSRAIIMSGVSVSGFALNTQDEAERSSLLLARAVGCETNRGRSEIINCLRRVDAATLTRAQYQLFERMLSLPFAPTIDGYFIPNCIENLLNSYNAKRTQIMVGTTKDEGSYFIMYIYKAWVADRDNPDISFEQFLQMMGALGEAFSSSRGSAESESIIDYYTNWKNPEDGQENLKKIVAAVGDSYFVCPNRRFADIWSGRGLAVYQYHFTHRTSSSPWPQWMGVMHADDIEYAFGVPLRDPQRFTAQERQLSLQIMELFVNFAKTGVPSPRWERYTEQRPTFLDLNATLISDETSHFNLGPRGDACTFWNKILPRIQGNSPTPSSSSSQVGQENDAENVVSIDSYVRDLCQASEGKLSSSSSRQRPASFGSNKNVCAARKSDHSRGNQFTCQC